MKKEIHLITGDDEPRIEAEAAKRVQRLAGDNPDAFALEVLKESDNVPPEKTLNEVLTAIQTPGFFGGRKTVWLKNFHAFSGNTSAAALKRKEPVALRLDRLQKLIAENFPDEVALVMSGPGVDARSRFYTACNEAGNVVKLAKPDLGNRNWRGDVLAVLNERATELGMKLSAAVAEYLVEVIGVDTGKILQELEKLYCYAGKQPTLEQTQEICVGSRNAVFYALNNALGRRSIAGAFTAVHQLLSHSDENHAILGLIRQAASLFKNLLEAKLLMSHLHLRSAGALSSRLKSLNAREQELFEGNALLGMHPFRIRMLAEQAENYRGQELLRAIHVLAQADRRLVSTNLPKRLVLENLILEIMR